MNGSRVHIEFSSKIHGSLEDLYCCVMSRTYNENERADLRVST